MIEIEKILNGINETECGSHAGWWETSDGAKFGDGKLKEVKIAFAELEQERDDLKGRVELLWNFIHGVMNSPFNCPGHQSAKKVLNGIQSKATLILDITPSVSLSDIKAQAVEDFIKTIEYKVMDTFMVHSRDVEAYTSQLRQPGE